MPIKPGNKARYPKEWKRISQRIRTERANNHCEVCGIENGIEGWRAKDGTFYTAEQFAKGYIKPAHERELADLIDSGRKPTRIVLTVAHLNHQPEDCRDENLSAMCQRCHLKYDHDHHQANARQTRQSRKSIPLFA